MLCFFLIHRILPYTLFSCRCGVSMSQIRNPLGSDNSNEIELCICKSLSHMSLSSDSFHHLTPLSFINAFLSAVMAVGSLCDFYSSLYHYSQLSSSFAYAWQLGISDRLSSLIQSSLLHAGKTAEALSLEQLYSLFFLQKESWVLWDFLVAEVSHFYVVWQCTGLSFCQKLDYNC